jgi:hypothetical protein
MPSAAAVEPDPSLFAAPPPGGAVEHRAAALAFESVWPQWYVRYCVERAPFRMASLPAALRLAPAYLTAEAFIDVRGVAPDGMVHLDPDSYEALCWWDSLHPVVLFIHDAIRSRWCLEPISAVSAWVAAGAVRAAQDRGGRTTWSIPASLIFEE